VSQPTEQRPPQVTLASGIIMFASLIALAIAWEQVATLGSLDTQESIRDGLAGGPLSLLGLDLESAAQLLRITCMVVAACACATAILGWFVRKPDRSSRLALTIFAGPVFVAGTVLDGVAGSFVAAGTAMLWLTPAREWFATGRWTPPAPAPQKDVARREEQPPQPPTDVPSPPPATWPFAEQPPPARSPYGQPYPQPHAQPAAQPQAGPTPRVRAQQPPAAWRQRELLESRPGAMVAAFVLTVVMAGGLLALSLLWVALAGLSPDFLMSVLEQQQPELVEGGLTLEQVRSAIFALGGAFIVWCAIALLLAGFAMARREWARRGLMMSAAFSAGACFALVLNTLLVLIPAAAAVATVLCLRRVEVRRWFSLDVR
jgi:hypothetical protein